MTTKPRSLLAMLIVSACLGAAQAPADWLVTQDGARVETDGGWEVDGRRVIFTRPNGTLAALRLSEVDLEASRAATELAKKAAEAPEESADKPKPKPVLVLTDKDIPKAAPEILSGTLEATASTSEGAPLRVIEWDTQAEGGGILMLGRVENATGRLQSKVQMTVEIHNQEGETLASAPATLAQTNLVAGGITVFRARFPDLSELPGPPHFVVESSKYTMGRDAGDLSPDDADGEDDREDDRGGEGD